MLIFIFFILHFLFSVAISTPISELSTLMTIKASLDPQNQVLTSWTSLSSSGLCDGSFEGVACNEFGHVANISLQGKGLNGKIPSALSELQDLTGLYLHFNALTGQIPKEIGRLSKLTDLYLNVNDLSGNIPPQIGNMSNLQVLQLCYNKLTGSVPTQLSSLKNLDVLALQYNHLTGAIPATLGLLTTLTRLDLSFNNLFGPIPVTVANAPMLRVLDVRNNTLSGNVPQALTRLGGGFQYQNNPNLCGVGFPNIENCPANLNPDKPQPLGPDTLLKKNIPESADLKTNCQKPDICPKSSSDRKHRTGVVLGAVLAVTAFVASVSLAAFSWHRRQKQKIGSAFEASEPQLSTDGHVKEALQRRRNSSPLISLEYSNGWDPLGGTVGSALSQEVFESFMFNLEDVERATQCFSEANLLGKSNFSSVYKGVLRDGSTVAVKCIAKTSCKSDEDEFLKGLKLLTLMKHENLVRLRGFCCSKGRRECFLIYEYVPNGNLLQYLDVDPGTDKVLQWSTRITIINGIAQGIEYVHGPKGKKPGLVHQNISAEKVLIDHWNNPLVADSGLHKLLADDIVFSKLKAAAAMGYLAPEYVSTGRFTDKCDVYAFGIILFQILSGKRLVTPSTRLGAEMCNVVEFIDPNLDGDFVEDEAVKLGKIALLCTHDSPSLRPPMENVVKELGSLKGTC